MEKGVRCFFSSPMKLYLLNNIYLIFSLGLRSKTIFSTILTHFVPFLRLAKILLTSSKYRIMCKWKVFSGFRHLSSLQDWLWMWHKSQTLDSQLTTSKLWGSGRSQKMTCRESQLCTIRQGRICFRGRVPLALPRKRNYIHVDLL